MATMTVWRARVPADIIVLIAAVTLGGTVAGFLSTTPLLFVTTPAVAAVLAVVAALENRLPAWQRAAVGVVERLSDDHARALLDDLLRRAWTLPTAAHVEPLVTAACEAARQLSALELHLAAFEAHHTTSAEQSDRWRDAFERCRRGATLLTRRLEDASAALSRWQAAQGSGESLGELARELNEESRYQQEAAQDVEALLS